MGLFAGLSTAYVMFAFAFQAIALGFIGLDPRCQARRVLWLLLTLATGPLGLLVYFLKGRN